MNAAPTSWRETARPVSMGLRCGGHAHTIRWTAGVIELDDHPELEAEQALIALGGTEPPCLGALALWEEAIASGGFLAEWIDSTNLTTSRLSWLTMALERLRNEGFHEFLRDLSPARAERMGRFLVGFNPVFLDRAAGHVAEAISSGRDIEYDRAESLIAPAIAHRLRRSFVDSVGGQWLAVGAAALVPLRIDVQDSTEPSAAGAITGPARGIELSVGSSWLHEVWAAEAAVIDKQLILDLDGADALVLTFRSGAQAGHRSRHETGPGSALTPVVQRRQVHHDGHHWMLKP